MICDDVQGRLTDALLGEVPPSVREELLDHAARCASCAAEAEELRQALDLLRASSWPGEAVLGPAERRRLFARATAPRRPIRWLAVAAALAAAAVVAGLGVPALRRTETRAPAPPVAAEPAPAAPEPAVASHPLAPPAPQAPAPRSAPSASAPAAPAPPPSPAIVVATESLVLAPSPPRPQSNGAVGGVVGGIVAGSPGPVREPDYGRFSASRVAVGDDFAVAAGRRPPPSAMFFEHRGTNPWVSVAQDPLSTFGLDVDTASYALAREYIRRGLRPPRSAVRVEEFVNAVAQDEPPPPGGETFGIRVETARSPFQDDDRAFLRIGIRAKDLPRRERKPAHLVFVVDVSGSMAQENRLGLVQRSLRLLVDRLDERDWIGIVVYGTHAREALPMIPVSQREAILQVVDDLRPEGSTNLEAGLVLGYRMASARYDRQAVNRVVLCTDGVANNGLTDPQALLEQIKHRAEAGIDLTALGFGMGNFNDALLQRLADEGDGQYAYIDDFAEARRFFLRDLTGVLQTVARDARAQVEFDPGRVTSYRLIGYEKRDLADEDFRNDAVDAGEVNAGQTVTVLYELVLPPGQGALGTVRVRFLDPDTRAPDEVLRGIADATEGAGFENASPAFQLTVLAARFAEHLRESRFVPPSERLDALVRIAHTMEPAVLRRPAAQELVDLIREAARLPRSRVRD
jgi:Ca-activated chloride channel family protein